MNGTEDFYITTGEARGITGLSTQSLRSYASTGKIRFNRLPSGRRIYNKQDVLELVKARKQGNASTRAKILYARVSSKKQTADLNRQVEFLRGRYPHYELVKDIGSGINWQRKGLRSLLERANKGEIEEIVVAHKDRLARFAFELIEYLMEIFGVKLVVLSEENPKPPNEQLADDILSIIHVYNCKSMGRRRYQGRGEVCDEVKEDTDLSHPSTEETP